MSTAPVSGNIGDVAAHPGRGFLGWVADRSIRTKIFAVIGLLSLVAAGTGVVAVVAMRAASADNDRLMRIQDDVTYAVGQINAEQAKARLYVAQISIAQAKAGEDSWVQKLAENDADLKADIATFSASEGGALPGWKPFLRDYAAWVDARDSQLVPAAMTSACR